MKNEIHFRIGQLRGELSELEASHDKLVKDYQTQAQIFQQKVQSNQLRFQQITGAITELTKLLQHEHDTSSNGSPKPGSPIDRLLNPRRYFGDNLGSPLGHRELDQPNTSTGETRPGDHLTGPDHTVGGSELHGS